MEEVEHQQCFLQRYGGNTCDIGMIQQIDQRLDVVATDHGAEQLGGFDLSDQSDGQIAVRYGRQEAGLDLCGIVYAGRHTVREQVEQECVFARVCQRLRVLDQLNELGGLLGIKRQGRDTERGAFGNMLPA